MAAFKGKDGAIKIVTTAAVMLNSWAITFNNGMAEDTSFGESFSSYEYTIQSATATVSGLLELTNASSVAIINAGETAAKITDLRLYINDSEYYSGTGIISSFTVTAQVGNLISATFNITWDGGCDKH
jgi:hypothetical protein